jgi:Rieske Fe-S protein
MADALAPRPGEETALRARRSFLGWLIGGIIACLGAAVGIPAVGAVLSAARGRPRTDTIPLGRLADYPLGEPRLAQFTLARVDGWVQTLESRAVWVVRTGEQAATVFNGRCTHLGCAYSWKTAGAHRGQFLCPCHDGVFARDGQVVEGPPPRGLDTLPARVEDGTLVIAYQDFRLGVPQKEPA